MKAFTILIFLSFSAFAEQERYHYFSDPDGKAILEIDKHENSYNFLASCEKRVAPLLVQSLNQAVALLAQERAKPKCEPKPEPKPAEPKPEEKK